MGYHPYPRWKYHATKPARIVESAEEEVALGDDWHNTPQEAAAEQAEVDERAALLAEADGLGLTIDRRMGNARIKAAIDAFKASRNPAPEPDPAPQPQQ